MKKIAKTKITNSSLTTVPRSVKMFLDVNNGDEIEWCINEDQEVTLKRCKDEK
jgi:bifunctional DNA-binding transcriptional regulator/antitoxin component of YhaV-PrlF toxin-antitoxin module